MIIWCNYGSASLQKRHCRYCFFTDTRLFSDTTKAPLAIAFLPILFFFWYKDVTIPFAKMQIPQILMLFIFHRWLSSDTFSKIEHYCDIRR